MTRRILTLSVMALLLTAVGCASTKQAEKPETYYFNALAAMNHGAYDRAELNLKKAIELKPGSYNAHIMLGKVYEKEDKKEQALGAYRDAVKLDPKDARGYLAQMNVLLDLHKPAESAAIGEAALTAGAPKVNVVGLLGWSYYEAGDLDKAEADYRSAIELSEDDTSSMNNLGILLFTRGKYVDALSMFQVAHDKNPQSAVSPYLLALTYNKLGRRDEALESLKEALKRDPELESRDAVYRKRLFMHADPGDLSELFSKLKASK